MCFSPYGYTDSDIRAAASCVTPLQYNASTLVAFRVETKYDVFSISRKSLAKIKKIVAFLSGYTKKISKIVTNLLINVTFLARLENVPDFYEKAIFAKIRVGLSIFANTQKWSEDFCENRDIWN
jgi:hypothetical protein